ncbi:Bax inhibitor-1 family protein [Romboutsia sedimentorum]|uniref:Bax inhibitor-1 family protein n=1 Tax=Romboutsia sedimentorum TaxID=1368474 RepID=UPI0024DE27F0|nr:Bax inhibitor-1 family protein [Romboutsia sedimentorum]MDK2584702.1 Bax inhibitor-1 family protein [Romboutsia sedimentorum]
MSKTMDNPMASVFKYLALSILFMFIGFAFGQVFIPESIVYYANFILIFVLIGLLILAIMSRKSALPVRFSMNYVYIFTFIDGILIYPILQMYIKDLGAGIVMDTLIGTVIILTILSIVSNKKEAGHYLNLGKTLLYSLIGLLIFTIISIFIDFKLTNIILSIAGIIIFSGFILYDISLLKEEISKGNIVDREDLSIHVLNIYLDFVNIFLDLLRLIWELKN